MKARKKLVAMGEVVGGLFDLKQIYEIFYLQKEQNYPDKISLEITLKKEGENKYARRSLRFNSHEQLYNFISDLILAYILFLKKRNVLFNEDYLAYKFKQLISYANQKSSEIKEVD